jgi:hypothetical protein
VVLTKRRVSAFAGSDLDVILRAGGIDALILSGIATSGCVLSTLRQAADLDFSLAPRGGGMFASQMIKPPTGPRVAGALRPRVNVRGPGGTLYVRSPQGEV